MTTSTITSPRILDVYDAALRRAEAGEVAELVLRSPHGTERIIDTASWCRMRLPGDSGMLNRCSGPTLDVGCGPGRLINALSRWGCPALGVDVSATAVRMARARGATALRRDVFGQLPGHGRWRHLLLADGNIGIGGDPVALLRRCRELLGSDGRLHAEVSAAGTRSWAGEASVRAAGTADTAGSATFRWAEVAAEDLAALAELSALRVTETWREAGRWFATLTPA
ncbi:class I SAM-dependent methyltransferase [Amorphoplanes nipponensis]|uniref:Methyltransferase type 12 n=1 Tax=Actinoplanes nipponensis TaxID=135950 RepID=A0A919JP94_9ACTN|nr:class I SAM-dependent methyltransferase [Actinoplanes nipponensis]GIE52831.1 methyltransferase type 12 [Actinoplanes nipponensis]